MVFMSELTVKTGQIRPSTITFLFLENTTIKLISCHRQIETRSVHRTTWGLKQVCHAKLLITESGSEILIFMTMCHRPSTYVNDNVTTFHIGSFYNLLVLLPMCLRSKLYGYIVRPSFTTIKTNPHFNLIHTTTILRGHTVN